MRAPTKQIPLLALPLALCACDPPAPPTSATSASPATTAPAAAASPTGNTAAPAEGPRTPPPVAFQAQTAPTTAELAALAKSDNAFALDFYARARAQRGNLVMSPFSIATALSMTWVGARGETAAQMKKVLHLESDRAVDVAGSLTGSYAAPDQKVTVRIANRLFGQQGYPFEPPYLSRVRSTFGAPLEQLDFASSEPARGRINAWVAKETEDRIKDLIPQGSIDATTRLVLTNAIYFLGDWAVPFKKESTSPAPFFASKTEKKDVPTMRQTEDLHYAAADGVKLVELPYQNGALAMTFVIPDAVDGLDALEARLTPAVLDGWLAAAKSTHVSVFLPKLEIAPEKSLSVADTLAAMGMPLAFDRAKADFTGIARPARVEDQLYISKVFHKAFVKVDEKGTEAAAASAAVMTIKGMAVRPTTEVKLDHPFLFFLRDTRSGLVLFMGRVADPSTK